MDFWSQVYELRKNGLIPSVWNRDHLRPHLQEPNGEFAEVAVNMMLAEASISLRHDEMGNSIKDGGNPKAWRVDPIGSVEYKLITDPDDDEVTRKKEHTLASARVREMKSPELYPLREKARKYRRPLDRPLEDWEVLFLDKWERRLNDRP